MPDDKMKTDDAVPQADKQAHTEIAEREGRRRASPRYQQGRGKEGQGQLEVPER